MAAPKETEILDALDQEVAWLHGQWIMYRQLFAKSEKRIELLNATASTFFGHLQLALLENITLGVVRLTDRLRMNKREKPRP